MDVRCERCRAQYVFDDEQVTPAGLTVQCTNCGHVFKVKKKELVVTVPVKPGEIEGAPLPATAAAPRPGGPRASLPAVPPAPTVSPPPPEAERPREWRVRQANGNTFTFRELTTLQKWIIEQKVSRDDEISHSGDQWKRLGNIAELASFFQVVEAAERSKTRVASPAVTMPAAPAYGGSVPPPPPSGFPPPAFAAPPPPPPGLWPPAPILPPLGEPVAHEVDLGPDVEAPARKPRRMRPWLLVLILAAVGGGAYVYLPHLLASPAAVPVQAEPPPEPPTTARVSPAPAPEPVPAPAPEPVPAPAPEPALQAPPEPAPPPKATPLGPHALLAQANKLLADGEAEAALEIFGRIASDDPENAEALTGRGLCYFDLEDYAPAEASFIASLRLDPGQPDALLGLAETYRYQGKKREAITHYERYLARYPESEEAEVARNALAELRK